MASRAGKITGWTATILLVAYNLFAALMKLFAPVPPGSPAEAMQERLGMQGMTTELGILELVIVILFIIPRTSTVGFIFMVGYWGGALATNITHQFTFAETIPMYITLLVLAISGYFRNPELAARLFNQPYPKQG